MEKIKQQNNINVPIFPTVITAVRNQHQHKNGEHNDSNNQESQKHNHAVPIQHFNGNIQQAYNFYSKEVNKLFFANMVLKSQLKNAIQQKKQLAQMINSLQRTDKNSQDERKKRHRRAATEIERNFKCPIVKCGKSYGSEGSLSQHVKLKHPDHHYEGEKGDGREQDPF